MTGPLAPAMSQPSVAIVLVNWNAWRDFVECLDSVLMLRYSNFHIYLVDNASSDGSMQHIQAWCASPAAGTDWLRLPGARRWTDAVPATPVECRVARSGGEPLPMPVANCRLTLLSAGGNLGFAGGNNAGIRAAGVERYDYFWLLNTDTVVSENALAALVERAGQVANVGMVGSTLIDYGQPERIQATGGALDRERMRPYVLGAGTPVKDAPSNPGDVERNMAYVHGASMLVSRRFIQDIGPMAEDYFLYYEELDWASRAGGRFAMGYAPASHVYHKGGGSSMKIASRFSLEMLYRNRLRFVARFHPSAYGRLKRSLAIDSLRLLVCRQGGHARAAFLALSEANAIYRNERQRETSALLAGQGR